MATRKPRTEPPEQATATHLETVPAPVNDQGPIPVALWPIDKVKRYPGNPRNNAQAIAKVARSIEDFGSRQPIVVDEAGVIIVGDTRLLAYRFLKRTHVPVHVATGLSPEKVRAYRIADNRTHDEAEWDIDRLAAELLQIRADGTPLEATGFEDAELDELLGGARGIQPFAEPDAIPHVPAEPKAKLGELYRCGQHLVLCGDATQSGAWERLMGQDQALMMFTDQPYDVNYTGGTAAKMQIQNDNLGHEGTVKLLRAALGLAAIHSMAGAPWYVCGPHGPQFHAFSKVATELGFWRQTILWVKDAFALGRSDYHYRHEAMVVGEVPDVRNSEAAPAAATTISNPLESAPREVQTIGYGWKPGEAHPFYGGRKLDTCWEVDRPRQNDEHPTAKPVELIDRALRASSKRGDLVIDPFGGSGSTLIACEIAGRRCRTMEIDGRYCDVIIARWEAATGQKAVLVSASE